MIQYSISKVYWAFLYLNLNPTLYFALVMQTLDQSIHLKKTKINKIIQEMPPQVTKWFDWLCLIFILSIFFDHFDILSVSACLCVHACVCKVSVSIWPEIGVVRLARDNSREEVLSIVLHSGTVQSLSLSRVLNSINWLRFFKYISQWARHLYESLRASVLLMLGNVRRFLVLPQSLHKKKKKIHSSN